MAAVFWASFSRRAMVLRRRVMRTTSSRPALGRRPTSRFPAGAAATLAAGMTCCADADAGAAAGAGAGALPALTKFSTSSFSRRPSLPVVGMVFGSRPCSCTSRRTAGDSGAAAAGVEAGAGAGAAAGAGATAAGAGAAAPAARALPALWVSSIRPNSPPMATVVSSGAAISIRTPPVGAGTSTATLSVSSSTNGSSWAVASPTCFSQRATVASVTDSPNMGTTILII